MSSETVTAFSCDNPPVEVLSNRLVSIHRTREIRDRAGSTAALMPAV